MFRFFHLLLIALISISVIGCGNNRIGVFIVSDIVSDKSDDTDTQIPIAICNVGDILTPGQSCADANSDGVFTVLENGNSSYTSLSGILFEATDLLDTEGASLNDVVYWFRASKLENGVWEILSPKSHTTEPNDTN